MSSNDSSSDNRAIMIVAHSMSFSIGNNLASASIGNNNVHSNMQQ